MHLYSIVRIGPDGRSCNSAQHTAPTAKEALEIYANSTFAAHVLDLIHPDSTFVATRIHHAYGEWKIVYTDVAVCKIEKVVSPAYKIVSI